MISKEIDERHEVQQLNDFYNQDADFILTKEEKIARIKKNKENYYKERLAKMVFDSKGKQGK